LSNWQKIQILVFLEEPSGTDETLFFLSQRAIQEKEKFEGR
jgi:hypothetical protein